MLALLKNYKRLQIEDGDDDTTTITAETSEFEQLTLNFPTGVSAFCFNDIDRYEQLQEACGRIRKDKKDGDDMTKKLRATKKGTGGICWKNHMNQLGKSVFDFAKEKQLKRQIETAT